MYYTATNNALQCNINKSTIKWATPIRTIKTDMYTVVKNLIKKTKQRKKQKQNKNITRIVYVTIYFLRQFGVFVFPEHLFTLIDESGVRCFSLWWCLSAISRWFCLSVCFLFVLRESAAITLKNEEKRNISYTDFHHLSQLLIMSVLSFAGGSQIALY